MLMYITQKSKPIPLLKLALPRLLIVPDSYLNGPPLKLLWPAGVYKRLSPFWRSCLWNGFCPSLALHANKPQQREKYICLATTLMEPTFI